MDIAFTNWIVENLHTPFLDWLMPRITMLGDYGILWIALSLALVLYKPTRKCGLACTAALLFLFLAGNVVIKNLVARARPYDQIPGLELLIPPLSDFSFPSSHTGSSVAVASVILMYNKRWGIVAMVLAVLISLSRLYLTVHFLTDVLAGAALGVLCAFFAQWLVLKMWKTR